MKTHPILKSPSSASRWVSALLLASGLIAFAAPPDLTNGGVPGDTVTTNLGATGLRGWVYHVGIDSGASRQIQVQVVDVGSPADGILAVGDVILGADGTGAVPGNFTADARKSFANAINDAEARTPAELKVLRWRAGTITTETLTLRTMGAYSATAPYNCPKSAKILEEGLEAIMTTGETAGSYSLGTLTLLAGNNPSNPKNATRQTRAQTQARALIPNAAKLADLTPAQTGFLWGDPWGDGHELIVLTEYYLQTNDALVLPAIDAYSKAVIGGQNLFGTYSHVYAARWRDGTPNGPMRNLYGTVNNASMPGWLGLLLTKECGITNPNLDPAIERASRFYSYYSGKSSIPYGEHEAAAGGHENNGKSGLSALCFELESHRAVQQKFFAKMATAATTERDIGHTGPFFNHLWSPLGAAVGGEAAAATHFGKIRWMLDLNRRWNGLFVSNRYGEDSVDNSYSGFRVSTPILLTYALPLRQLHITGRGHDPLRQLSAQEVTDAAAADGYKAAHRTTTQLFTDLGNWSPCVQRSAAFELGNRAASITTAQRNSLHTMANDPSGTSRVGATFALGYIGHSSSASVLATLLTDPVNHVRYAAAVALTEMPQSERSSQLNTVLAAAASTAAPLLPYNEEDPAHLTHSSFGRLLFASGGMVPTNYSTVDRNLLYPAIRAVAQNPVGYCRSSLARIYDSLSQTDYQALADTVVYSAYELTPADKMFAYEDRFSAQRLLKRFNAAEGVPLCVLNIKDAMYNVNGPPLATLQLYAGDSKTVTPDPGVEEAMNFLIQTNTNAAEAQAVLDAIAADTNIATLQPLKSIQSVTADAPSLTLPANSTALHVTASDLAKGNSIYTWRKVHGVGTATFTPNGTGAAKDSMVLISNAPGKYRFEVTMSDSLGLTEVYKTVDVTLYASNGTLPPNSPPVANPQSLTAPRGITIPITLSSSDPEAYPLIYRILTQPADGDLDGTPPNLTYTARPGGTATSDSFTFEVMDSEGQTDLETISLTIDNTIRAEGITWSAATNTTSPTNVVTAGTFVDSRTGSDSTTITVNGVTFQQGRIFTNAAATSTSYCPDTGTGTENIALESLLDRISSGGSSFQLTGLTPGSKYLIQIFLCDYRSTSSNRQMVLDDKIATTPPVTLNSKPSGAFGQNVIGTFTASSWTQTIYVTAVSGSTYLNSWQLRSLPDGASPTPSPLTWATPPTAQGMHTITMTASTASDANGVEYYFDETSGKPGATDSGWQDSPVYTDRLLTPGTTYTYQVIARDKSAGHNTTIPSTAISVTTGSSNLPSTVWNVNIGNEITTGDNFIGAATENTANSTWNSVVNPLPKTNFALVNSSGAATTARLDINAQNGGATAGVGSRDLTSGAEIFRSYFGGLGTSVTMLLHGLPAGHTYDLIVYSDWFWKNGDSGYPVTQTIGTGLSGTVYSNRSFGPYVNGQVPPLQEDPNPANVMGTGNEGNWYRIRNLTPDEGNQLGFRLGDGVNGPFNGFQLIGIPIDPGDLSPPAPNAMTWTVVPTATGPTSITMTATTASDVDGVEYLFEETSGNAGGTDSVWQDSPVFTDTGLTTGMSYTYRVKARDKSPNANETGWSPSQSAIAAVPNDTSPPTPSPMTWANAPAATGQTSITMTASTATDASGVEYYFDETSGNPGGSDSYWQDSPSYTDTGLTPGTSYTYTVRARDKSPAQNSTSASTPASATTAAPDMMAPTPNPMTWATPPAASGTTSITMTATTATDASGVEYLFAETSGKPGATDSGWQDSPSYTDTDLTPGTSYTYTVTARDKSLAQNPTAASTPATAATNITTSTVWNVNVGNGSVPITTADNYIGAATENTPNSTWNSVTTTATANLADSTGSSSQGIAFKITPLPASAIDFGSGGAGDKIFHTWIKDNGNNDLFQINFANLPSGSTYDLIVYSEWHWANSAGVPVNQIAGSGLTGTFHINHGSSRITGSAITPLLEDANPANINSPTENTNYARIRGLSPDGSNNLTFTMGGVNAAVNGFQLIQFTTTPGDISAPTPSPMTWASAPAATGQTSISMTASTATDASGVEYLFEEISGNPGGTDSVWQDSPVFTDTDLTSGMSYTYRVKARDKSPNANETEWSPVESATTHTPPDDYTLWAAIYAPADLSDPTADHDGDGLSNDNERAFGLDPTSGTSVNPISVPLDPANGTLSYTRRSLALTKLSYSVWTSTTLGDWTEDATAEQTPGATDANGIQTVAVKLSAGLLTHPKLFVRIIALKPAQ